jgi:Flp pilus assembly protein protease CpaA
LGDVPISAPDLLFKTIITAWLVAIAYSDRRTMAIPNWLTLSALGLFGGIRLAREAWHVLGALLLRVGAASGGWAQRASADAQAWPALRFMFVAWFVCFALWELHVIAGGDAKTLMALLALFPSADFIVLLCAAVFVLGLPLLLLKLRGRRLQDVPSAVVAWFRGGHMLPTQQQLEQEGKPYAWMFCLPGVVYLWLLW